MNVPYHWARLEGRIARSLYRAALSLIVLRPIRVQYEVPLDVFSYSGESTLPEQVASVRSFLRHAGRPKRFTIVSDGSYTNASIELLEKIDNCVRVQKGAPPLPSGLPEKVQSFLTNHFTGRQLALIMSLPANGPTLYADSDILFFPQAIRLSALLRTESIPAFYLADYQFSADQRLIQDATEKEDPVNMGFLLLFQRLDWSVGLERLKMLNGVPNFFTTQTVVHLSMHANGAHAFDRHRFVLQADDEFVYHDRYAGSSIAMRHYVNPVRHKFWAAISHQLFR